MDNYNYEPDIGFALSAMGFGSVDRYQHSWQRIPTRFLSTPTNVRLNDAESDDHAGPSDADAASFIQTPSPSSPIMGHSPETHRNSITDSLWARMLISRTSTQDNSLDYDSRRSSLLHTPVSPYGWSPNHFVQPDATTVAALCEDSILNTANRRFFEELPAAPKLSLSNATQDVTFEVGATNPSYPRHRSRAPHQRSQSFDDLQLDTKGTGKFVKKRHIPRLGTSTKHVSFDFGIIGEDRENSPSHHQCNRLPSPLSRQDVESGDREHLGPDTCSSEIRGDSKDTHSPGSYPVMSPCDNSMRQVEPEEINKVDMPPNVDTQHPAREISPPSNDTHFPYVLNKAPPRLSQMAKAILSQETRTSCKIWHSASLAGCNVNPYAGHIPDSNAEPISLLSSMSVPSDKPEDTNHTIHVDVYSPVSRKRNTNSLTLTVAERRSRFRQARTENGPFSVQACMDPC